eukprot:5306840-Pleurochrysis_carterae.AAC.1
MWRARFGSSARVFRQYLIPWFVKPIAPRQLRAPTLRQSRIQDSSTVLRVSPQGASHPKVSQISL